MAVKDLVELFDPETTSRRLSSTRPQADSEQPTDVLQIPALTQEHSVDSQSRHTSPKFLAHPLLRRREPSQADDDGEGVALLADAQVPGVGQDQDSSSSGYGQVGHDYTVDVTDGLPRASGRSYPNSRLPFGATAATTPEDIPLSSLGTSIYDGLPSVHPKPSASQGSLTGSSPSSVTHVQKQSLRSTTAAVHGGGTQLQSHTPIPLTTVFSRKAPPLYLPKLDDYISSLPAPSYVASEQTKKPTAPTMFPPMQALADTKKTLADLEHNATIPPGWRNCSGIFSTFLSLTIGVTVCT